MVLGADLLGPKVGPYNDSFVDSGPRAGRRVTFGGSSVSLLLDYVAAGGGDPRKVVAVSAGELADNGTLALRLGFADGSSGIFTLFLLDLER